MRSFLPVRALGLALLVLAPATAQEAAAVQPPALATEVLPAPSAELRRQHQLALKTVWLERLIRAREERHRITRENMSQSLLLAQKMGAPAAFVDSFRRLVAGNASPSERHELELAQQDMLAACGVDARELRFFVEGCGLTPAQLREVAAWLPLHALFNRTQALESPPASAEEVQLCLQDWLSSLRELTRILPTVVDTATADAAAEVLLPPLERFHSAMLALLAVPEDLRVAALAPHAAELAELSAADTRERTRLQEAAFFDSPRLLVLDYLFH